MAQIKKRIDPRIEIRGAAQAVTGAARNRDIFTGVVDQRDRDVGSALKAAEVAEKSGNLTGRIFIDGMKSDQRIEQKQHRAMEDERDLQPFLIGFGIQP